MNPLAFVDDWGVLRDGSVALIRGEDFRVDWVSPSLRESASPAMAFPWTTLTAATKRAIVDSTNAALDSVRARAELSMTKRGAMPSSASQLPSRLLKSLDPEELPDRRPAFRRGSVQTDPDGRLWIQVGMEPGTGGPIYFVINRAGAVVDRVQLPRGRTLVGFGRGSTVYLGSVGQSGGLLERASLR
jgi:hypothetical protein